MVAAAACGGGDDDDSGGAAGGAVTTSTSTTSTTAASTSSTSADGVPVNTELFDGPDLGTDGAAGAGCTPGEVDQLPEGWWAGTITAVEGPSIEFDLVCWFGGEAGEAAAAEDGVEFTNDYYVRNTNPRTFTETFASPGTSPASCLGAGTPEPTRCTIDDVLHQYAGGEGGYPIVWLHVTGTTPDYLFVQYTP